MRESTKSSKPAHPLKQVPEFVDYNNDRKRPKSVLVVVQARLDLPFPHMSRTSNLCKNTFLT